MSELSKTSGLAADYYIDPIKGLVKKSATDDYMKNFYQGVGVGTENQKTMNETSYTVPKMGIDISTNGPTGTDSSWMDTISGWFKPNDKGFSTAGSVFDAADKGVSAFSGLAGMYYQNKMAGLAEDRADMEKDAYNRQVRADEENEARLQRLAKNVGNDAFYK